MPIVGHFLDFEYRQTSEYSTVKKFVVDILQGLHLWNYPIAYFLVHFDFSCAETTAFCSMYECNFSSTKATSTKY